VITTDNTIGQRLSFDAGTHSYLLDGEPMPSVTNVLSRFWLNDNYLAMQRGTKVHEYSVVYDLGDHSPPMEHQPYCKAYIAFREEGRWEPVRLEMAVASSTYRYAGTLDRVFRLPTGEFVLLEIKSGSTHPTHVLQLAAYQQALNEWEPRLGLEIERAVCLYLQPSGRYSVVSHSPRELEAGLDAFLTALRLHRWEHEHAIAFD
jgi:hypothetical protein